MTTTPLAHSATFNSSLRSSQGRQQAPHSVVALKWNNRRTMRDVRTRVPVSRNSGGSGSELGECGWGR